MYCVVRDCRSVWKPNSTTKFHSWSIFQDTRLSKEMKNIVIFGSTGMTGLCALEAALKKDFDVRAFVCDPTLVPDHLNCEIVEGNVLEPYSVYHALDGMDGVVVALGTRNSLDPTTHMSDGIKIIIEAMSVQNVNNISVCLSAFLFYEPDKVPPKYNNINDEHKRMYQALSESSLNYIAVCPPRIVDEPSRDIIVEVNPTQSPGRTISKWDLGSFLVNSLSEPKYYNSMIGIANVPKQGCFVISD